MNAKQRATLKRIFSRPTPPDIRWTDIENLLVALGATVTEGAGSRVRVQLKDVRGVFHRPHPERVTDKGSVNSVRRFLTEAGVTP